MTALLFRKGTENLDCPEDIARPNSSQKGKVAFKFLCSLLVCPAIKTIFECYPCAFQLLFVHAQSLAQQIGLAKSMFCPNHGADGC